MKHRDLVTRSNGKEISMANQPLRIPAAVRPPAHIRVVSPAAPMMAHIPVRAQRGEQALTSLGFTVSYGKYAHSISEDGMTAGSARERAGDLMAAFEDPGVHAVLSSDAGMGTRDLLDYLDPAVFRDNPKPFIGTCDNVFVNQFLASIGLSSLYGCTLMAQLGEAGGAFPEVGDYLLQALARTAPLRCTPVPSRTGEFLNWFEPELEATVRERRVPGGWTWLRPGTARGVLLGGEITALPELAEKFSLDFDTAVLFWHVAFHDNPPDMAFRELSEKADLTRLAGLIIGAHPSIAPAEWAGQVSDMVDETLPDISCPVVVNADIGNLCPCWTVPYGEEVVLDSSGTIDFWRGEARDLRGLGRPDPLAGAGRGRGPGSPGSFPLVQGGRVLGAGSAG
jgi:muramoyltetrapeptide carboxypeptidase